MNAPEVSVVMSVYNGADILPATLESVLGQEDCDFEFRSEERRVGKECRL